MSLNLCHPNWVAISDYIRKIRSNNNCEWCKIKNSLVGYRDLSGKFYTRNDIHDALYKNDYDYFKHELSYLINNQGLEKKKPTKIVLAVIHYDYDNNNNIYTKDVNRIWQLQENNLFALCQRCNLKHSLKKYKENRSKNKVNNNQLSIGF
jgi:hypothetical protein